MARTRAQAAAATPPARWKVFGISFGFIAVLMSLWSLASPLMSVPDEPAHVVRAAAAARGEFIGPPSPTSPWLMQLDVPSYVADSNNRTCYVFDPEVTPDCYKGGSGQPDATVESDTSAGTNNPLYYAAVGWPSLFLSGDAALYGMRIVSSLLCAVLFGFMFMALSQLPKRRWTLLAAAASVTPMVLFLGGSVNPNGIEVAGAAALFATLVGALRLPSPGRLLWERGTVVVFSTLMLVTARSIALLWLALALAGALLIAEAPILRELRGRIATWVTVAACALACLFAVAWLAVPFHLAEGAPYDGVGSSFRMGAETMVTKTFEYAEAWIGLFGWVATPAPTVTLAIWTSALAALILGALALGRGRLRLLTIGWAIAVVVVPAVLQGAVVTKLGYIWQGRYDLALAVCLLVSAGLALDARFPDALSANAARLVQWGLWLLGFAQLAAFLWVLKRYVVASRSWLEMVLSPSWSPPGTAVLLGFLFAAVVFLAVWTLRRPLIGSRLDPSPPATATQ